MADYVPAPTPLTSPETPNTADGMSLPNTMSPGANGPYGAEVLPNGPLQDMENSLDVLVGNYPPLARDADPASFTGGMGGQGLGGVAEGSEGPAIKVP